MTALLTSLQIRCLVQRFSQKLHNPVIKLKQITSIIITMQFNPFSLLPQEEKKQ
jgi:hypothetical protein